MPCRKPTPKAQPCLDQKRSLRAAKRSTYPFPTLQAARDAAQCTPASRREQRADSSASLLIVRQRWCAVGNVDYQAGGGKMIIFTYMFWEGEKRRALGPTDSIHKLPL